MTILLTGANGFIGHTLSDQLTQAGHDVIPDTAQHYWISRWGWPY